MFVVVQFIRLLFLVDDTLELIGRETYLSGAVGAGLGTGLAYLQMKALRTSGTVQ